MRSMHSSSRSTSRSPTPDLRQCTREPPSSSCVTSSPTAARTRCGPGERHRAAALDHRHEVGEPRDVGGARRARPHQRRDLRDHAAHDDLLAEQVARAGEQRADRLLDARARGVEQPDERHPLGQRELAQARDLHLAGHPHRAGHDREVVGADGDEPPVDLAVAGDDAVGRRLLALQPAHREKWMPAWMPSSVNVPSSISSASRSRAVSLSAACCAAIFSSPPPSRACARRSCRSSTSGRRMLGASRRSRGSCDAPYCRSAPRRPRRRPASSLGRSSAGDLDADHRRRGPATLARAGSRRPSAREPAGRRVGYAGHDATGRARRRRGARRPRARRARRPAVERRGRRRRDALELDALAAVDVAHAGHHDPRGVERRAVEARRPRRPHAPARHMPPRNSLGVVSGVLKSACASSQSTNASGRSRASTGQRRDADRARSARSSTGKRPSWKASSSWPPASSRQPRDSRRSSS